MSVNAVADAAAAAPAAAGDARAAEGTGRLDVSELTEHAVARWKDDALALTILAKAREWINDQGPYDIYRALTNRRWQDLRTGVVYAYTFREASTLAVVAAACTGQPELAPKRPELYTDAIAAGCEMTGFELPPYQPAPRHIVIKLETMGFRPTSAEPTFYLHRFMAPTPPEPDARLRRALVEFTRMAWAVQDMHELEAAMARAMANPVD